MPRNLIYLSSPCWRRRADILKTNNESDKTSQVTLMHSQHWGAESFFFSHSVPDTYLLWFWSVVDLGENKPGRLGLSRERKLEKSGTVKGKPQRLRILRMIPKRQVRWLPGSQNSAFTWLFIPVINVCQSCYMSRSISLVNSFVSFFSLLSNSCLLVPLNHIEF